jgi:iron complex outermembrane recepter protein
VPLTTSLAIAYSMYDIASVSVLKGPQGTLFGVNTTGGAIVFQPNKPTHDFEAYAEGGAGNYDRKELRGMINVPVSEVVQLRFAGEAVHRDGFVKNLTPVTTYGDPRTYGRRLTRSMPVDREASGC